jgi:hypothetical protein
MTPLTQTLTQLLPEFEREPFKQTAVELKAQYESGYAYWLALADAFENEVGIQAEMTLPDVGRKLEDEIFKKFALGDVPVE